MKYTHSKNQVGRIHRCSTAASILLRICKRRLLAACLAPRKPSRCSELRRCALQRVMRVLPLRASCSRYSGCLLHDAATGWVNRGCCLTRPSSHQPVAATDHIVASSALNKVGCFSFRCCEHGGACQAARHRGGRAGGCAAGPAGLPRRRCRRCVAEQPWRQRADGCRATGGY